MSLPSPHSSPQPHPNRPVRILVVDVDPEPAERLRNSSTFFPNKVTRAASIKEAKGIVEGRRTDLILLNPNLPGQPGWEWLQTLSARPPDRAAPVVLLLDPDRAGESSRGYEWGADHCLIKPCDESLLAGCLLRLWQRQQTILKLILQSEKLDQARQAAEQAARTRAGFLASMSHEIRTPMNGVIAMTGLLLQTDLNADQRDFVDTIRTSGEALLTIINDILNLSKIEAGKMELEQSPFNLRTCIEEALDMVASKAAEQSVDLLYHIEDSIPSEVIGDVTRLRQIIVNLVGNAAKFTAEGEIFVDVRLPSLSDNPPHEAVHDGITFSVRDTGVGIAPEKLSRLFQPFSQADSSITRHYGGTGLGLAISKGLVDLMGGFMWVESEVGKGSTFHFTIPLPQGPTPNTTFTKTPIPTLQGRRILVVDDNPTSQKLLSEQLGRWGMLPEGCNQPSAALNAFRADSRPEMLLLDLEMPGAAGTNLLEAIRAVPQVKNLPAVVLTRVGKRPQLSALQESGPTAHVCKPVKPEALYRALIQTLSHTPTAHAAKPNASKKLDVALATRHPLRILLADDNLINLKVASRLLRQLGYEADTVKNGIEVLAAIEQKPFDLILMDVQMPEMDGLEVTAEIRHRGNNAQAHPHFHAPIAIIAMTANAMHGDREKCLAAGMDDYLAKPVRPEALQTLLEKFGRQIYPLPGTAVERPGQTEIQPRLIPLSAPTPSNAPVDLERLMEFAGGSDEALLEIIGLYFKQTRDQLQEMRDALDNENARELSRIAHSCAGASATCGMNAVLPLLRRLESDSKAGCLDDALTLLEQVSARFEEIQRFLNQNAHRNFIASAKQIAL